MNKPESSEMVLVPRTALAGWQEAGTFPEHSGYYDTKALGYCSEPMGLIRCWWDRERHGWYASPYSPTKGMNQRRMWRTDASAQHLSPAAHPFNQVLQEPVASVAHIEVMPGGAIEYGLTKDAYLLPEGIHRLYASPQAVPSEQPIAEQPKAEQPDSVYLGSAGPSEDLQVSEAEQPAKIETLDQFFAEAQRIGLTAGALAAALSKRPEFADCVPQTTFTLDDIGDALKGLSDDWQELIALRLAAKRRVEPGESAGAQPSDKKYLPAASLPVSAPAGVRMLTDEELRSVWLSAEVRRGHIIGLMHKTQRKFCEVNGLKLAAATTEPKP